MTTPHFTTTLPDSAMARLANGTGLMNVTNAAISQQPGDLNSYIQKSCNDAVNRIVAVWLVQLLTNLTNHTVSDASNVTQTNQVINLLDAVSGVGPELLSAGIMNLLASSGDIQNAIQGLVLTSATFSSNVTSIVSPVLNNTNDFFLLTMGIFIYFMQTGFALMEVGMVRTKNTANSLWKNVSYSFASALGYWLTGMALSFGQTDNHFTGRTFWAFKDMPAATGQGVDLMYFFFEYVFCTTAGAIMSGAIAERAQLGCYIIYTFVASAITYPVVVHWVWHVEGWLTQGQMYEIGGQMVKVNFQDFAGSGVVHACGGAAALVGIIFLGPRIGRFGPNGEVNDMPGHSISLVGAGAMTLFTGFLAFNAGSETAITNAADALPVNRAATNTILCGTGGFMFVGILYRIIYKRWLIIPMLCGGLAGNVAACANCNTVESWGAFCIGIFSGVVFVFFSWALRKLRIDDAADAVGVHLGGGFAGVVGLAFFKIDVGIFYNWDKQSGLLLAWQLLGFVVISLWSGSHTYVLFYVMKMFNMIRVDPETELVGLDYAHGHELAYPKEAYQKPNIHPGGQEGEVEESLDKMYDSLFEEEMSKYTVEYINNPGWSHPVFGGVLWDLSWISVVRSRRKEMEKRHRRRPNSTVNGNGGIDNVYTVQPATLPAPMDEQVVENGGLRLRISNWRNQIEPPPPPTIMPLPIEDSSSTTPV